LYGSDMEEKEHLTPKLDMTQEYAVPTIDVRYVPQGALLSCCDPCIVRLYRGDSDGHITPRGIVSAMVQQALDQGIGFVEALRQSEEAAHHMHRAWNHANGVKDAGGSPFLSAHFNSATAYEHAAAWSDGVVISLFVQADRILEPPGEQFIEGYRYNHVLLPAYIPFAEIGEAYSANRPIA
jgi:hypothetical protein